VLDRTGKVVAISRGQVTQRWVDNAVAAAAKAGQASS
jgi:hypothetical protein